MPPPRPPLAPQGTPTFEAFILGLCAGAITAPRWRPIVKSTVKAGIKATSKVTRTALRCAEDLVDVVQEARSELAQESQAGGAPGVRSELRRDVPDPVGGVGAEGPITPLHGNVVSKPAVVRLLRRVGPVGRHQAGRPERPTSTTPLAGEASQRVREIQRRAPTR